VAETEERNTPDVVTADYAYYRYRKPTYTPEERKAMVARIREHLSAGRDVFAYFKHEETPQGALYAVEILKEVSRV
jgi:acyl-CoA reductase-like NAD-dependent aldehyde dehydrogenase